MKMVNMRIASLMKTIKETANLIYKDMEKLYPYEIEQFGAVEDYMMLGYDIQKAISSSHIDDIRSTSSDIEDDFYKIILDNFEDLVVASVMLKMNDTHKIKKYTTVGYPNNNALSVIGRTIVMYSVPDLSGDVAIRVSLEFGYNINSSGAMQIAHSTTDDYITIVIIDLDISHSFVKIQERIYEYLKKKFFKANEMYTKPLLNCKQIPEDKHQEVIDKYVEYLSYHMIAFYMLKYVCNVEEFLKGRE